MELTRRSLLIALPALAAGTAAYGLTGLATRSIPAPDPNQVLLDQFTKRVVSLMDAPSQLTPKRVPFARGWPEMKLLPYPSPKFYDPCVVANKRGFSRYGLWAYLLEVSFLVPEAILNDPVRRDWYVEPAGLALLEGLQEHQEIIPGGPFPDVMSLWAEASGTLISNSNIGDLPVRGLMRRDENGFVLTFMTLFYSVKPWKRFEKEKG